MDGTERNPARSDRTLAPNRARGWQPWLLAYGRGARWGPRMAGRTHGFSWYDWSVGPQSGGKHLR